MNEYFSGMEYIYAVYQEKSFSAAAKKLFLSQPALSASIKKAEEALGAPIAPFMQIRAAESAELTADAQTLITVSTGNVMLEFTVDGESGLPISICEKTSSGETVMEFKIAEYKIQNPSE